MLKIKKVFYNGTKHHYYLRRLVNKSVHFCTVLSMTKLHSGANDLRCRKAPINRYWPKLTEVLGSNPEAKQNVDTCCEELLWCGQTRAEEETKWWTTYGTVARCMVSWSSGSFSDSAGPYIHPHVATYLQWGISHEHTVTTKVVVCMRWQKKTRKTLKLWD